MATAYLVLFLANVLYATSYTVSRIVLVDVGPATLGLARLVIGAALLMPWALLRSRLEPLSWADRWRIFWMGVLGFGGAFALGNWGLARSTASNAALLITVEPASLIVLAPLLLGERLTLREVIGATLTMVGAVLVVVNGIPGVTLGAAPHWRGDLLLILSGLAYASYSLLGRSVLRRYPVLPVTAWSILWGAAAMLPLAALEWARGPVTVWTPTALAGTLYLGVAITALGYTIWNYALERVEAPRAAVFLNLQPLIGALLGVWLLHEPLTPYTAVGGVLILAGLHLTVKAGRVG